MRLFILGLLTAISLNVIANVNSGSPIKSDLINAILDIEVYDKDYIFGMNVGLSNNGAIVSRSSNELNSVTCSNLETTVTGYNDATYKVSNCDISSLGLTEAPSITITPIVGGSVSYEIKCVLGDLLAHRFNYNCSTSGGGKIYEDVSINIILNQADRVLRKKTIRSIILGLFPNIFN
jgi:hypothetical protein